MHNVFARADVPRPDGVTVRLWRDGQTERGEVIGPAATDYRAGSGGSLSVDEALAIGCELANRYGLAVVVMDEAALWPTRWGTLAAEAG